MTNLFLFSFKYTYVLQQQEFKNPPSVILLHLHKEILMETKIQFN